MMCEACDRGDHEQCGMQTWCECDCEGHGQFAIPDDSYFVDDLDGGRLVKKETGNERANRRIREVSQAIRPASVGGVG